MSPSMLGGNLIDLFTIKNAKSGKCFHFFPFFKMYFSTALVSITKKISECTTNI